MRWREGNVGGTWEDPAMENYEWLREPPDRVLELFGAYVWNFTNLEDRTNALLHLIGGTKSKSPLADQINYAIQIVQNLENFSERREIVDWLQEVNNLIPARNALLHGIPSTYMDSSTGEGELVEGNEILLHKGRAVGSEWLEINFTESDLIRLLNEVRQVGGQWKAIFLKYSEFKRK